MSLSVQIRHQLDNFDLDIAFDQPQTGLAALFGPSGSGKSLTINMIAGLIRPEAGHITLNGKPLFSSEKQIHVPPHKRRIGYVFQDSRLFPHLTIEKNLLFGAKRAQNRPTQQRIDHLIDLLEIRPLLKRFPARLSGGEKQRVAIGRALLSGPDLLLLDEPTTALDHRRQGEIIRLIEALRDDVQLPILYVSHSISEVTRLADHMILLDHGAIAAQGPVHDIMSRIDLFPLTGRFEAGSSLDASIFEHDEEHGMTMLAVGENRLWLPLMNGKKGDSVRLRIRARDVMLSLNEPEDISANNILPVTILDWRQDDALHMDIQLQMDQVILIARITRKSWQRLDLAKGKALFAIVKSVSLDRTYR